MVSNARLDLPEPESPVTTTRLSRGISSEMFFRLCTRAPWTAIVVRAAAFPFRLRPERRSSFMSTNHGDAEARSQEGRLLSVSTEPRGPGGTEQGGQRLFVSTNHGDAEARRTEGRYLCV